MYLLLNDMLQVKTFRRNGKDRGFRDWWGLGGNDPVEFLDMEVNEFCRTHDVVQILHHPPIGANRYYTIIYKIEK